MEKKEKKENLATNSLCQTSITLWGNKGKKKKHTREGRP